MAEDLGSQRGTLRTRRRRAGWRGSRRTRRARPRAGPRAAMRPSSPSRSPFARASASASSLRSLPVTSRSGRSSFSASATAPLPVPTSSTRAPRGSPSPTSTSSSVSGRGISARRSTAKLETAKAACARRCRRPARAPPRAGAPRPGRRGRRALDDQVVVDDQPLARDAEHVGQQQLGVQARGFAPGRRDRGDRPLERVPRGSAPHAAACASRPRRFSSDCSDAVSSSSSPSSTWSRLWTVSFVRWSVTRRSP